MLRYFPRALTTGLSPARRRLAPLLLVGGLLVVGKLAYDDAPHERALHFVLPSADVSSIRVTYSMDDEPYGGMERHFPEGAPAEIVHRASLASGRYELAIELTSRTGATTQLTRSLQIPGEGTLRIPLTGPR